jgi:hypothetical protein
VRVLAFDAQLDPPLATTMLAFAKLFTALFPLFAALTAVGVLAIPAIIHERDSLDNRWNVIYKQVGKHGVQQLCQAILPHATTTKTGMYLLFQMRYVFDRLSSALVTSNTPITATETSYTTDVAYDYTTETQFEDVSRSIIP